MTLGHSLAQLLDAEVTAYKPLAGGQIGQVYLLSLANGEQVVAKTSANSLRTEAHMLRYLRTHSKLPVPAVIAANDEVLVLEFIPGSSHFSEAAERHAATLLADLHSVSQASFGFEQDTLIGDLRQPNPITQNWISFFAEQRLRYMTHINAELNKLPAELVKRLEQLTTRLDDYLDAPQVSLIHGDVWAANVLCQDDRVTAFLDPALYYGAAEAELAYIALFDSFSQSFFEHYHDLRPIDQDFWTVRRHVYALYPLLVHVYYFDGHYVAAVDDALSRLGV